MGGVAHTRIGDSAHTRIGDSAHTRHEHVEYLTVADAVIEAELRKVSDHPHLQFKAFKGVPGAGSSSPKRED